MTASELDALDRRLDEGEALEWDECLDVLEGLIKALREAHSKEEKMQRLLRQASGAIVDGYLGGEWAHVVHMSDDLCWGAAKEANDAEETLHEIWSLLGDSKKYDPESMRWVAARNETKEMFPAPDHVLAAYRDGQRDMKEQAADVLATSYDAGAANLVLSLPILPLEQPDAPKD